MLLFLNCTPEITLDERKTVIPDDENIHKFAFPDTLYNLSLFEETSKIDEENFGLFKVYDINFNNIPDFGVLYYLKNSDRIASFEIDSSKMPPLILKNYDSKGFSSIYKYNKEKRKYEFVYAMIIIKNGSRSNKKI